MELYLSVYIKDPAQPAEACVIWMHGLGADAADMMGLADQFMVGDLALRHVFLDSPTRPVTINGGMVMPAWYDIVGGGLLDRQDKAGIAESATLIRNVVDAQLKEGFKYQQIFLAGFSQGAAMALHTALHLSTRLGGVIALSGYLPLADETAPQLIKDTPFFIGSGEYDPVVIPSWVQMSKAWLLANGYTNISFHQYPMEHSICFEEVNDLSAWFRKQVRGAL